jgi:hypothetical protein
MATRRPFLPLGTRCRARSAASALFGQRRQILLAILKGGGLLAGRSLEIHPEPKHRNEDAGYASRNVLRRLPALFSGEFLYPLIVGLNLGKDRRTIHVAILRLNNSDGVRCAARARTTGYRQRDRSSRHPSHARTPVPKKGSLSGIAWEM